MTLSVDNFTQEFDAIWVHKKEHFLDRQQFNALTRRDFLFSSTESTQKFIAFSRDFLFLIKIALQFRAHRKCCEALA